MPLEPPDYYQNGYPVLAFLYALFTDHPFSEREHGRWAAARAETPPRDYRGYLDNYNRDSAFPEDTIKTIALDVPSNGPDSRGLYYPTPNQARVGIARIFEEIRSTAPAPRPNTDPRSIAQLGSDRPVLRILGVLFLNQLTDPGLGNVPAMIDGLPLDPGVKATLQQFYDQKLAHEPAQMSDPEAEALGDVLVEEFIGFPPWW